MHDHSHSENKYSVAPIAQKLKLEAAATGRGVTIAFLDAGFYPHPDLIQPENRILAYEDVTQPGAKLIGDEAKSWEWHGTQTSVCAAGNGYLSDGIFRGLAFHSGVVLVKVSDQGRITEENIVRGLQWVLQNRKRFNIRIVSISLGGDEDVPYEQNEVDRLAEQAISEGLIVVVAAGNSGCTASHRTVPPANSPSVITVGGYDDGNQLDEAALELYCSSFGPTADGIMKPEVIAPAMWIPAPILPHSDLYEKAEILSRMLNAPDYRLPAFAKKHRNLAGLPESVANTSASQIRNQIESLIRENKIISTHYQHVDGTSFAAPIVSSLIALMLETNPALTPAAVKNILISTAQRISGAPAVRQGYGVIHATAALEQAKGEIHSLNGNEALPPRVQGNDLVFSFHHDSAENLALAGDFNSWDFAAGMLRKETAGIWQIKIPVPTPGRYRYKFVLNGNRWLEDPCNGLKEPDNYGGFNSIVTVN